MANIPYPAAGELAPETCELLTRLGSLNVTRMMAHSTRVLDGYSRLGLMLLRKGKLDPLTRELAILRVGILSNSPYEWHQHVGLARALGASEAAIEASRTGHVAALDETQRLAIGFAEEICREGAASPATLAATAARFSPEQLVELTLVCGYYRMTAAFLNTFAIEIEDSPPLGETIAAGMERHGVSHV